MRFSWVAVPLLALTLSLRLMAGSPTTTEDRERAIADTRALLEQHGYQARIDVRGGPDAVLAARGDCALAASAGPVSDEGLDLFRRRYAQGRDIALFYRSGFVSAAPRLRSAIDFYAYRHLSPLGFEKSYPPLVMIAATGQCDLAGIPWQQLRLHPLG